MQRSRKLISFATSILDLPLEPFKEFSGCPCLNGFAPEALKSPIGKVLIVESITHCHHLIGQPAVEAQSPGSLLAIKLAHFGFCPELTLGFVPVLNTWLHTPIREVVLGIVGSPLSIHLPLKPSNLPPDIFQLIAETSDESLFFRNGGYGRRPYI